MDVYLFQFVMKIIKTAKYKNTNCHNYELYILQIL